MPHILTGILSLIQYKNDVEGNFREEFRPERCESCGKAEPWRHGHYPRKALGSKNHSDASQNPIMIQRYYCPACQRTMSALPECLPPHRWHVWEVQQGILLLIIEGISLYKIAKISQVSRHTVFRWISRFKTNFLLHRDTLIHFNKTLCMHIGFDSFWAACFKLMSLSEAMRLCHISGVIVP